MVGIGIFQTPPLIASSVSNEAELYYVWLIGAICTIAGALTYIELSTTFPEDGGDYQFLTHAYSPLIGFLYGWSQTLLIRPGSIAAISFPCAQYIKGTAPYLFGNIHDASIAALLICLVTFANFLSSRKGLALQNILSISTYVLLLCLVVLGVFASNQDNVTTTIISGETNYGLALILVLFCFGGWSELSLVAGEIEKPKKNFMPGLLIGILLITIIYIGVNYSFCRQLGFHGLTSSQTPAADMFPGLGMNVIAFLITLACLSSLNAFILAGSRIPYALGKDHILFSKLSEWDDTGQTPIKSLLFQAILAVAITLLADSFTTALVYTTTVVWIFYLLVGLALFLIRKKCLTNDHTVLAFGYPMTPALFCLSCVYVIYSAYNYDSTGSLMTFAFVLLGIPVYFMQRLR